MRNPLWLAERTRATECWLLPRTHTHDDRSGPST